MYASSFGALHGRPRLGSNGTPSSVPTQHVKIQSGESGNFVTLGAMRRLVREGARNFIVRQRAIEVIGDAAYNDVPAMIGAIKQYCASITFVSDPLGDQILIAPDLAIELADAGHARLACASIACLSAAMARSVGLRTAFALYMFQGGPRIYSHVFSIAADGEVDGQPWFDMDSTAVSQRGTRAAPVLKSKIVPT